MSDMKEINEIIKYLENYKVTSRGFRSHMKFYVMRDSKITGKNGRSFFKHNCIWETLVNYSYTMTKFLENKKVKSVPELLDVMEKEGLNV